MVFLYLLAIGLIGYLIFWLFDTPEAQQRRAKKRAELAARAEEERRDAIRADLRKEAVRLDGSGAIFVVTDESELKDHFVKALGWVSSEAETRSEAERLLTQIAAQGFNTANALLKLQFSLKREQYEAGRGAKGRPHYKTKITKVWEAQVSEATPLRNGKPERHVWSARSTVIDGSNVAHWGSNTPTIDAVRAVVAQLKTEGSDPIAVFDANIGFKVSNRFLNNSELAAQIGLLPNRVEVVPKGEIADIRVFEIAMQLSAPIVSNDLYRDHLAARFIPKRRGFFAFGEAELLPPRPALR